LIDGFAGQLSKVSLHYLQNYITHNQRDKIMAIFGRETPLDRPNPGGRGAVFIASEHADESVTSGIKNGAGMVGFGNADGTVTVYFESNKFNESGLQRWEDKCFRAYDRMVKQSPTVNKVTADAENFVQIGFIEGSEILVRNMESLEKWLKRFNVLDSMPAGPEIHSGK
jgi:hypothetical protein